MIEKYGLSIRISLHFGGKDVGVRHQASESGMRDSGGGHSPAMRFSS